MLILYNTLMGHMVAAGMLLGVAFAARASQTGGQLPLRPWAWTFAAIGLILVITGAHMSLTWPLAATFPDYVSPNCCRADNIIFGEPTFFFGALLLGLAGILHGHRGGRDAPGAEPEEAAGGLGESLTPLAWMAAIGGLMLFPMGIAGAWFGMFVAPPGEPISSWFRQYSIETVYVVVTYWIAGIGAVLTPFAIRRPGLRLYWAGAVALAAVLLLWLSLITYIGHITLAGGDG